MSIAFPFDEPPADELSVASRRELLLRGLCLASASSASLNATAASTPVRSTEQVSLSRGFPMYTYVGSRTTKERNARGEGISIFRVAPEQGSLELVAIEKGLINPSYLTLSKDGQFLYTVHGDESEVSAFKVDRQTGRLTFINRESTQGKNPVHLALDPCGKFLVVSNHIGASLAVLPVNPDGSLGPLVQLVGLEGPIGPHRVEQKQAKPHFNPFDPSGKYIVVPDKGLDRVFSFAFVDGKLEPAAEPYVMSRETSGPRHLAFHPYLPVAYVINELDSTVTGYHFDASNGALRPFQLLSALPDTFAGNSRASGIAIDTQGRFLYASNRGYDSLAIFAIDARTGRLSFLGAQPTGGKTPRFFALSPNGRFIFALNEDSDSIVTFAIDPNNGTLSATGAKVHSGSPVCMVFSA